MLRRTKGREGHERVVMTVWVPAPLHAWLRARKYSSYRTIEEMVTEALEGYKGKIEAQGRPSGGAVKGKGRAKAVKARGKRRG